MLFRALLTRLLRGSSLNQDKIPDNRPRFEEATYRRYPRLIDFVLRLLQASAEDRTDRGPEEANQKLEMAFPALEILESAGAPQSSREIIQALLFVQLGQSSWILRDKAARTLSVMMEPDRFLAEVKEGSTNCHMTQNQSHGVALCLKHVCCRNTWRSQVGSVALQTCLHIDLARDNGHIGVPAIPFWTHLTAQGQASHARCSMGRLECFDRRRLE